MSEYEIVDGSVALTAVTRAEIDVQVATAKAYPRSVVKFREDALALATLDQETAASCFYSLPRDGKQIIGPSVRLAEIIAHTWRNIRAEARVVGTDEHYVTAVGMCHDLETNTAARHEVKRRITNKAGKRFSDDMITVTANAACSVAFREAVFKVVPRALWKGVYDSARKTAVGDQKTLASRRDAAVEWCLKAGVTKEAVFRTLGVNGMEEIGLPHLEVLTGIRAAVRNDEITLDEAFAAPQPQRPVPPQNGGGLHCGASGAPTAQDLTAQLMAHVAAGRSSSPVTSSESANEPQPDSLETAPADYVFQSKKSELYGRALSSVSVVELFDILTDPSAQAGLTAADKAALQRRRDEVRSNECK